MAWVTAKLFDVLLYPFKSFALVFQAVVDTAAFKYFFAGEESIRPNTIVECNDDNVHLACQYKS